MVLQGEVQWVDESEENKGMSDGVHEWEEMYRLYWVCLQMEEDELIER